MSRLPIYQWPDMLSGSRAAAAFHLDIPCSPARLLAPAAESLLKFIGGLCVGKAPSNVEAPIAIETGASTANADAAFAMEGLLLKKEATEAALRHRSGVMTR